MFSMTVEYALRAAVYLSEVGDERCTAQRIAEACKVPVSYMSKVLQSLVEARLVEAKRGPSGGFVLARKAKDITLLEVVEAIDPIPRITSCPIDLPEHEHELCPLHKELDALAVDAMDRLRQRTLADVMAQPVVPLGISVGGLSAGRGSTNGIAG